MCTAWSTKGIHSSWSDGLGGWPQQGQGRHVRRNTDRLPQQQGPQEWPRGFRQGRQRRGLPFQPPSQAEVAERGRKINGLVTTEERRKRPPLVAKP